MSSVPSFTQFIEPLLRYLAKNGGIIRAGDCHDAVADIVGLTDEQRAEMLPSGNQQVYKNRIGWAHDRLKRQGLSGSPKRGYWQVTSAGLAFVAKHPEPLNEHEVKNLWQSDRTTPISELTGVAEPATPVVEEHESPQERIERAIQELNESVAAELLAMILDGTPTFFENLVLDLLHAMGYGASRAKLMRVGGSGDGGIDGIISLDKLWLEKVYVQAKRWRDNSVGRPQLQAFFGALAGRKASKGVFITTARFTREAEEFAAAVSDSIVLVDGERLTELMIEHGVGVSHKRYRVAKVDTDYFEGE